MSDTNTNGATEPSVVVDCSGASRVEKAPPNGQYDFTVLGATVKVGKPDSEGRSSVYANMHYQLDTEPAKNRHVFEMQMIRLKDGSIPGTPAAIARNYNTPFILGALLDLFKLPTNAIKPGEITELHGKTARGVFRAQDDNGEERLKLTKIVGAPTGKGFTPAVRVTAAPDAEDFN